MKKIFKKQTTLQSEKKRILNELKEISPEDARYEKLAKRLKEIVEVKSIDKKDGLNPNTIATIVANLAIVAFVSNFEQTKILSRNALSWIIRK